jgi:hypothetical protein
VVDVVAAVVAANSPDVEAMLLHDGPRFIDDKLLSVDRGITHNTVYKVELEGE